MWFKDISNINKFLNLYLIQSNRTFYSSFIVKSLLLLKIDNSIFKLEAEYSTQKRTSWDSIKEIPQIDYVFANAI